ncbi:hypothetical protein PENSPDRAFT_102314 [Peniophora sp. CONT]|nr:hypothetical protein PENSPDRAFT_102314 [Peniophora sp. CONT]
MKRSARECRTTHDGHLSTLILKCTQLQSAGAGARQTPETRTTSGTRAMPETRLGAAFLALTKPMLSSCPETNSREQEDLSEVVECRHSHDRIQSDSAKTRPTLLRRFARVRCNRKSTYESTRLENLS